MPVVIIFIVAVMLIVAAFPMPFGYYNLIRIVAMAAFFWLGAVAYGRKEKYLPWLFYFLAILFNPIIKISLPKELWAVIDISSALILIAFRDKIMQIETTKVVEAVSEQGQKLSNSTSGGVSSTDSFELRKPAQFKQVSFELTGEQIIKLNEWLVDVEKRAAEKQFEKASKSDWKFPYPRPLPYHGATGGELTFNFTPNGIGLSCKVTEAITGESIELTDQDAW